MRQNASTVDSPESITRYLGRSSRVAELTEEDVLARIKGSPGPPLGLIAEFYPHINEQIILEFIGITGEKYLASLAMNRFLPREFAELLYSKLLGALTSTPELNFSEEHLIRGLSELFNFGSLLMTESRFKEIFSLIPDHAHTYQKTRFAAIEILISIDHISATQLIALVRETHASPQYCSRLILHPSASQPVWEEILKFTTVGENEISFANDSRARQYSPIREALKASAETEVIRCLCHEAAGAELNELFERLVHQDPTLALEMLEKGKLANAGTLSPESIKAFFSTSDRDVRLRAITALGMAESTPKQKGTTPGSRHPR